MIFANIISLHANYREDDRTTWPTMSLLQKAMTQFGLASPRRVEDLVARLIHTGLLESVASRHDRRFRILTPSAGMLSLDRDWLAAHYVPLQVLFPDPGYAAPLQRNAAFQRAQRVAAMNFFGLGARILAGNPAMMLFLSRDAGVMVLIKLLQMAGSGGAPVEALSYADIGARFGVSRTHVRLLLEEAQKAGLVGLGGRGGRLVELKPAVWQAFDRFVAESMSGHDLLFRIAQRPDDGLGRPRRHSPPADDSHPALHRNKPASRSRVAENTPFFQWPNVCGIAPPQNGLRRSAADLL